MSEALKKNLRSPAVLLTVAGLALAGVGAKFFWPGNAPLNVPAETASAKPKPAGKDHPATASKNAAAKNAPAAPAAKSAKQQIEKQTPAAAPVEEPAPAVEAPAPVAAPVRPIAMPPRRGAHVAPADVDMSSDTEGLFVISSLRDSDAAGLGEAGMTAPKGRQNSAPRVGEMSDALSEQVVHNGNPAQVPSPTQIAAGDGLGPVFVDETNGFFMRFPAGWSIRKFESDPWVAECGDGQSALMSIGLSSFPAEYTADNIPLDWVARRIKKRPDTQLVAQGYAKIMGRKAIWSKSAGPMQMRGQGNVNVMRTTYIIPLGDGRVAEIRIASSPEQFEKTSSLMKDSVSTFRLIQRKGATSSNQQPQASGEQLMVKTE